MKPVIIHMALAVSGVFIYTAIFGVSLLAAPLTLILLLAPRKTLLAIMAAAFLFTALLGYVSFSLLHPEAAFAWMLAGIVGSGALIRGERNRFRERIHQLESMIGHGARSVLFAIFLAWAASLAFKAVPLGMAAAWAFAFLALWCAAGPPATIWPSIHKCLSVILLVLLWILIAAPLAEGGARILGMGTLAARWIHMPHSKYLFTLRPNSQGRYELEVTGQERQVVVYDISGQGLRDRMYQSKTPDEFRILMLGDSFTFGQAVGVEDTIPKILERSLEKTCLKRITVINAGVDAYGPWQELGRLEEVGLPLEPDMVILQLYPSNDIENELEPAGKMQRAYDVRLQNALQAHRLSALLSYRVESWLKCHSRVYQQIRKKTNEENWVIRLSGWLRWTSHIKNRLPVNEDRPFFLETDLAEWYPELDEGFELLKKDVLRMEAVCSERGIDFLCYCVPDLNVVDSTPWETKYNVPTGRYEKGKSLKLCEQFLRESNIPYIQVLPKLVAYGPVESTHYILDGHFNAVGNGIVAQELKAYLINDYFPKKGLIGK